MLILSLNIVRCMLVDLNSFGIGELFISIIEGEEICRSYKRFWFVRRTKMLILDKFCAMICVNMAFVLVVQYTSSKEIFYRNEANKKNIVNGY
uniref:Uncharacterized protein n=1 Tax=Vespula pensylvanica TaxID=30213 RepID=A0A834KMX4_VESPE|nr:hypothetical protein H0235_013481 [Vespula pensylvanica]